MNHESCKKDSLKFIHIIKHFQLVEMCKWSEVWTCKQCFKKNNYEWIVLSTKSIGYHFDRTIRRQSWSVVVVLSKFIKGTNGFKLIEICQKRSGSELSRQQKLTTNELNKLWSCFFWTKQVWTLSIHKPTSYRIVIFVWKVTQ